MNRTIKRVLIAGPFVLAAAACAVSVVYLPLLFPATVGAVGVAAWFAWALLKVLDGEW